MAGKRQFDEDAVLLRARELFRHRGYGGTSIDDLVRETGLGRGSLYGAYGGKAELYELILKRYHDYMVDLLEPSAAGAGVDRVRGVLLALLTAMEAAGRPGGCLFTNTFAEPEDTPQHIQARARAALERQQTQMYECLAEATDAELFGEPAQLRRLAKYFVGIRQSICMLWRAGSTREQLEEFIDVSLDVLPRAT